MWYRRAPAPVVAVIGTLVLCVSTTAAGQSSGPTIKRTARNTIEFTHSELRPVSDDPMALEIGDGDLFQVVITHTDPRLFRYAISAIQDESLPASSLTVEPTPVRARIDGRASLTMRHDKHFTRYRVSITALPGVVPQPSAPVAVAPGSTAYGVRPGGNKKPAITTDTVEVPESGALYPVSFDVWVITRPEWKVSFSGGVAFSGLTDPKYYIKTDAGGSKTVEEDTSAKDSSRTDIVAVANVYFDHQYWRGLMFGGAFGIGQNSAGAPRYYAGPSLVLGRNFVFSGGLAFGSVAALPPGQATGRPPVNGDNTLTTLGSKFRHGWFFGIAFTFVGKESEFKNAFSSTATTSVEGAVPVLSIADLEGEYVEGSSTVVVTASKSDGKPALPLTLTFSPDTPDEKTVALTQATADLDYTSADGKGEAKFSSTRDSIILQYLEGGVVKLTAVKAARAR